jgi:hypothetical protein
MCIPACKNNMERRKNGLGLGLVFHSKSGFGLCFSQQKWF